MKEICVVGFINYSTVRETLAVTWTEFTYLRITVQFACPLKTKWIVELS